MDAFSGSQNGRTLVTTAKTGCLSSPPVMNPRLGAKERSKSTGWSSSTVICVRGAGQGCFFRYKTGSISVTGSLSAARTRVYDTNPPLVGLVRPVSASYAPAMSFSFSSTPHRGRSHFRPRLHERVSEANRGGTVHTPKRLLVRYWQLRINPNDGSQDATCFMVPGFGAYSS